MYFDPAENLIQWIPAIQNWLFVCGGLIFLLSVISLLNLIVIRGASGFVVFGREVAGMVKDIFSLSPRRIWALSRLTFLEAYRRKALAIFVVFELLFMFAGWFMDNPGTMKADQVKVYISFVLTAMSWLTLPAVLILCCFGIPEDIRLRSIHTVVTKPARRLEIVLGRIIGISMIGGVLLGVMAVIGYIWIIRQTPKDLQAEHLTCRVPVYGTLEFTDRDGQAATSGVNTGDIWAYRSYIEGATKARAIWTFTGVNESMLDADGNLHLENSFSAFRTYKGDMSRQLFYDIRFFNPENNLSYSTLPKSLEENRKELDQIPRAISTADGSQHDLIKDFVTKDGKLLVEVSCVDREQYIGMARSDLYIRMPDRPFIAGYFKAVLEIALIMVLITIIGVAASSVVKGPIATILTFVLFLLSGKKTHEFIEKLVSNDPTKSQGGGPLESIYRLLTHLAPSVDLPDNAALFFVRKTDQVAFTFLSLCKQIIPQTKSFNGIEFVSNGFDVPFSDSILPSLLVTLAFFLPCVMIGYFSLRVRELESK